MAWRVLTQVLAVVACIPPGFCLHCGQDPIMRRGKCVDDMRASFPMQFGWRHLTMSAMLWTESLFRSCSFFIRPLSTANMFTPRTRRMVE